MVFVDLVGCDYNELKFQIVVIQHKQNWIIMGPTVFQ